MNIHIGERIKSTRKQLGMSQQQLSKLSGISQQIISRLESKKAEGTTGIVALANALKVTPEWLQTGKEARNRVDMQMSPVMSLDDATPEDLARIILAYEQSSDLKKLALQKLSELPEDKLNAILSLIG
jgi:transcriptional regulator with XRE-family HTH domain